MPDRRLCSSASSEVSGNLRRFRRRSRLAASVLAAVAASGMSLVSATAAPVAEHATAHSTVAPRLVVSPTVNQEVRSCPTKGGTLTVDMDETVLSDLDPSYTPQAAAYRVIRTVFDSLVYQSGSGHFSPWLASKWTVNKTDTAYTFTIRKGVKFTDGTPLNAAAVKYTFDRIESPAEGSLFAISLLGPYEDSVVNNPYSITVNFKSPYPAFLEAASQAFLGIVSPTAVASEGSVGFGQNPVGSGPFKITSNVANQQVTEVRNPAYGWGPTALPHKGPACLAGIDFTEVPQASTRIGQLLKNQVDAAETILPPDYQAARKNGSVRLYVVPGAGAGYQYLINTQSAPWNESNMRIALRDAINLPKILQAVYQGEYTQAWSPIMPNTADYNPKLANSWSYNPKLAAKILDASGWLMGSNGYRQKNGQTLTINFLGAAPDRELRQEVSVFVQAYLKAIGIQMNITNYVGTAGFTPLESGNYGITAVSFITASPTILFDYFSSTKISSPGHLSQNFSRLDSPLVDGWLNAAQAATNPKVAAKYWGEVQTYIVKNAVSIPIELEPFILATNQKVHGLTFDRRDYPMYYGVWLTR